METLGFQFAARSAAICSDFSVRQPFMIESQQAPITGFLNSRRNHFNYLSWLAKLRHRATVSSVHDRSFIHAFRVGSSKSVSSGFDDRCNQGLL
jgi:hypothetical protein